MNTWEYISIKVNAAGVTHSGLIRENNEDAYLINRSSGLFMVADGMGGHNAGEVASRMAIDSSSAYVLQHPATMTDPSEIISNAVQKANTDLQEEAAKNHGRKGMGTTLIIAWTVGGLCFIGHVGDVRGYLIRGGNLKLLTKDHSVVARILESGQITEEQARKHPLRNRLERAVGTDHDVKPDVTSFEVMHGDLMLLCSDGLWGMLDDNEIENVINSSVEVGVAKQRLLENALSAGGEDNITLILAEFNRN